MIELCFKQFLSAIQVHQSLRTWHTCLVLEYGDQEHLLESLLILFKL